MGEPRLSRWLVRVGVLLGLLAALILFHAPILRAVAAYLITEDPLEPAAAIIVAGGAPPFRETEAAALFHAGWAPTVVIVREAWRDQQKALYALGIDPPEEWRVRRDVLLRLGVPASAIVMPSQESFGTLEELQAAVEDVSGQDMPVILVTSSYHTRRVSLTWQHVTGGQRRAIVRIAHQDPFDPDHWWEERNSIAAVAREYMGLVNYWAGFPVPPGSRPSVDRRAALPSSPLG